MKKMLGKRPKKNDRRNLLFARYLDKLSVPPLSVDHWSKLPVDIGMMGNDNYGDCTVAAAAHQIQSWTAYTGQIETIPDANIMDAYRVVSPNDTGAYMLDVLNYWHKTGIGGDQIEAFVETSTADLTQCKLAIEYFGSHYIGISLPDVNTTGPWDVANPTWKPNPSNGHCVAMLGYDDARRMFKVATWGQVVDMSYGWFQKYVDESYAVLNDIEIIKATGKSPEGFDWAALQKDLTQIGDPVVNPTPVPTPTPVPPAPVPISGPSAPIVLTKDGQTNWTVFLNGVAQLPTHADQLEAVQHADALRWKKKIGSVLTLRHAATYKIT